MRTPGGLCLPDPEDRHELGERAHPGQPLPASAPGERFAIHLASGYFITDPSTWLVELYDPYVQVSDTRLDAVEPLVALLEPIAREGRPILLCAPFVGDEARVFLVANKLRGTVFLAAIDADPATLARIAAVTGAAGPMLGRAKRATIALDAMALEV